MPFKTKLAELGFELGDNALQEAFARFKKLADKKKEIFEDDLIALVEDEVIRANETVQFVSLQVQAGTAGPQVAEIVLIVDGQEQQAKVEGNGPVDAIFKGHPQKSTRMNRRGFCSIRFTPSQVARDAQAEVTVRLEEDGRTVNGQGADADTLVASARAYVNALNKLLVKRSSVTPAARQHRRRRAGKGGNALKSIFDQSKNVLEHRGRQTPGIGVVARAVITVDQLHPAQGHAERRGRIYVRSSSRRMS